MIDDRIKRCVGSFSHTLRGTHKGAVQSVAFSESDAIVRKSPNLMIKKININIYLVYLLYVAFDQIFVSRFFVVVVQWRQRLSSRRMVVGQLESDSKLGGA